MIELRDCRYCAKTMSSSVAIPTDAGLFSCITCSWCCDCGQRRASDFIRDPLCAPCLAAREERDQADMETAAEHDAEDRYYREGRYA